MAWFTSRLALQCGGGPSPSTTGLACAGVMLVLIQNELSTRDSSSSVGSVRTWCPGTAKTKLGRAMVAP